MSVASGSAAFLEEVRFPITKTSRIPNRENTASRIGNKMERSGVFLDSGSRLMRIILPFLDKRKGSPQVLAGSQIELNVQIIC